MCRTNQLWRYISWKRQLFVTGILEPFEFLCQLKNGSI